MRTYIYYVSAVHDPVWRRGTGENIALCLSRRLHRNDTLFSIICSHCLPVIISHSVTIALINTSVFLFLVGFDMSFQSGWL